MIYYIGKKSINTDTISTLSVEDGINTIQTLILNNKIVGFDLETNGLDPFLNDPLLIVIGTKSTQVVWNRADYELPSIDFSKITVIGHNIKFDYAFTITQLQVHISTVIDTMIASQKVYQGIPPKDMLHSLSALMERYFQTSMSKDIREEFIGMPLDLYQATIEHVEYAAKDVEVLFPVWEKLTAQLTEYKLTRFLHNTEFPKTMELAWKECIGFKFDINKWKAIISNNKEMKYNLEKQLYQEVQKIKEISLKRKVPNAWLFQTEKFRRDPHNISTGQIGLFGEHEEYSYRTKSSGSAGTLRSRKNKITLNFGSTDQVLLIFAAANEVAPKKSGDYAIPYVEAAKNRGLEFTLQSDFVSQFLLKYPHSVMHKFLSLYSEYNSVKTLLSSFGEKFFTKINPVTGSIHSLYRQATSITGRLQSGGGKKMKERYNAQNIPKLEEYRHAFTCEDTHRLMTIDWSGAEMVIMASLSGSQTLLKELLLGDIHSKIGTKAWRAIFKFRAGIKLGLWTDFKTYKSISDHYDYNSLTTLASDKNNELEVVDLLNKSRDFIVSKTENSHLRVTIKNFIFGSFYGMSVKKGAETLDIVQDESAIVLDSIKGEYPEVFEKFEGNLDFAVRNGYLVYNTRSNSRMWFPDVIKFRRNHKNFVQVYGYQHPEYHKESNRIVGQSRGSAYNNPIQGTQADALKEASVELWKFFKTNQLLPHIAVTCSEVHDELVIRLAKSHLPKSQGGILEEDDRKYEWKIPRRWDKELYANVGVPCTGKTDVLTTHLHEYIYLTFCEVANRYLNEGFFMRASYVIEDYWTK